jgi:hypothetical protein
MPKSMSRLADGLAPYPSAIGTRPTAQKSRNARVFVEGGASFIFFSMVLVFLIFHLIAFGICERSETGSFLLFLFEHTFFYRFDGLICDFTVIAHPGMACF